VSVSSASGGKGWRLGQQGEVYIVLCHQASEKIPLVFAAV